MKKATHIGHCQACSRVQMLPGDVLAKHGYTVDCGFFSGTCGGSGNLPYEKSCELVKKYIQMAKDRLSLLSLEIEDESKPATEPKGWLHEYAPGRRGRMQYQWRKVDLVHIQSGEYQIEAYLDYAGIRTRLELYEHTHKTLLQAADILNQRYVHQELRPREKKIMSYIREQERRVREWKLTDAIPLSNRALYKL